MDGREYTVVELADQLGWCHSFLHTVSQVFGWKISIDLSLLPMKLLASNVALDSSQERNRFVDVASRVTCVNCT